MELLQHFNRNGVAACEKLHILTAQILKIYVNVFFFPPLASDHGVSGIMPFEVSIIRN